LKGSGGRHSAEPRRSGALWSGQLAATLFSLWATLTLAGLNIRKWLTW
jgi:hypothetical protein